MSSALPLVTVQPKEVVFLPLTGIETGRCGDLKTDICVGHGEKASVPVFNVSQFYRPRYRSIVARQLLAVAILTSFVVIAAIVLFCFVWMKFCVTGDLSPMALVARAFDSGGNGSGGPFINNKLYVIIIVVGLAVVAMLGIMLSFWCCRGSFQNPLCCPCYLCACCGGLVCLECIGCGLCEALQ